MSHLPLLLRWLRSQDDGAPLLPRYRTQKVFALSAVEAWPDVQKMKLDLCGLDDIPGMSFLTMEDEESHSALGTIMDERENAPRKP